jgi:SAM-dependent methyltransferase
VEAEVTSPAQFPDIWQWYTADRVTAEEAIWAEGQHYLYNISRVMELCREHSLRSVIEVGCGTGWVPAGLDPSIEYQGIDNNPHMLELARRKNLPSRIFMKMDARDIEGWALPCDLVCSFAFFKHFSFNDWPKILRNVLSLGNYGLFNQHVLPPDRPPVDVGEEWHSIWPTRDDVISAVSAAGHEILSWDNSHIDEGMQAPESYIVTRRITL